MKRKLRIQNVKLTIFVLVFSLFIFHSSLLTFSFAEPPARIVSLAPGITEILFAAGLGENIVGVTTFCDYPQEAKTRQKVGGMSNPSIEAVVRLRPDIVVLTKDGNPKEFEQRLRSLGIKTYVFKSLTIPELPDGIREMGKALKTESAFGSLATDIEKSITTLEKKEVAGHKKVLFIVWPEPLIVAGPGTAIDDAITMIGAVNIAGQARSRYPKYSIEQVLRTSPDVIFIGKGMGKENKKLEKFSERFLKKISHVSAVQTENVFFVSDSLYRLGPRVVDGIRELAGYLGGAKGSSGQGFE
jgi:iron complex transport system substrate-binding protein